MASSRNEEKQVWLSSVDATQTRSEEAYSHQTSQQAIFVPLRKILISVWLPFETPTRRQTQSQVTPVQPHDKLRNCDYPSHLCPSPPRGRHIAPVKFCCQFFLPPAHIMRRPCVSLNAPDATAQRIYLRPYLPRESAKLRSRRQSAPGVPRAYRRLAYPTRSVSLNDRGRGEAGARGCHRD